ncbi:MAG TPA: prepilin-type N-terminal cleavage/methylation domain-containing protein [Gaiellaceae bacterium]|nr:prepilin-type N-terminal cleavage/methylation domain-containing protein [Gaiellaceae bacterium]
MSASSRLLFARGRDERGFGMVELVAAMTIMMIGVLAVFALFQSGLVQLRRASTITTAGALADAEMERFRAVKYETLGLDAGEVAALVAAEDPDVYAAHEAYANDGAVTTSVTGGLTQTGTTLTVASATGFPAAGEFRITIAGEVLIVTAGAGTTTWTVERGGDGTVPGTHNAGATVTLTERVAIASCSFGGSPCTSLVPTKTTAGADGKSYRVDTYIAWSQVASGTGTSGRAVKRLTVVVREPETPYKEWARVTSIFDEATGL